MPRSKNNLNLGFGMDVSALKEGFADAIKTLKKDGKIVDQEAKDMAAAIVGSMQKIERATTLKQASRQMQNLVGQMHAFGLEGSAAFNEVTKQAGKLQAELDDVSGFIKAARPDAPFQALSTTLGAAAQGFAGLQGAMALFGNESEDLQKTLVKVQAAMAFAEGFKAIDGLQDGFKQLNMVIGKNPLLAGAAVVLAVTGAIVEWSNATSDLTRQTKLYNSVGEEANKLAEKEYGNVTALSAIILDESQNRETRNDALKQLKSLYPEHNKLQQTELSDLKSLKTAIDEVTSSIVQRATVESAFNKLKEIGNRLLQAQLDYQNDLRDNAKRGASVFTGREDNISPEQLSAAMEKSDKILKENSQKRYDAAKAIIQKDYQDLLGFLKGQNQQLVQNLFTGGTNKPTTATNTKNKQQTPEVFSQTQPPAFLELTSKGLKEVGASAREAGQGYLELTNKITESSKAAAEFNARQDAINASFKQLQVDIIAGFGTAIGEALSGSDDAFKNFGKSALLAIAGFMDQLAKAQIATAIASDAFQKFLFTDPALALAAGVALAAGAALIRSQLQKGPQVNGFAEGGIIPGNSTTGDKLLAPVNSGEMVFNKKQQNQLLKIANGRGLNNGMRVEVVGKFDGRDLYLVNKTFERNQAR